MNEILKQMNSSVPKNEKEYEIFVDISVSFYKEHFKSVLDSMIHFYSESLQNEENTREQDVYIKATISTLKHQKEWFELLVTEQNNRIIEK